MNVVSLIVTLWRSLESIWFQISNFVKDIFNNKLHLYACPSCSVIWILWLILAISSFANISPTLCPNIVISMGVIVWIDNHHFCLFTSFSDLSICSYSSLYLKKIFSYFHDPLGKNLHIFTNHNINWYLMMYDIAETWCCLIRPYFIKF